MCFGSSCPICSGKSWRGCGSHVPSVLSSVPESEWCTCSPKFSASNGKEYPPQAGTGTAASSNTNAKDGDAGKNEL
ncbi:hypothetical protein QBC42DRAFT_275404 [Cladorrhinum samala]|uniref:Uncharacterized protein n=1 Tax=Cladorrhinum samala TaxID=585594 RepID=A0AAV9HE83_9PEZI|nr:hypothetical protein QBC42DRAFT_275404 [Cladorrhinum samala]